MPLGRVTRSSTWACQAQIDARAETELKTVYMTDTKDRIQIVFNWLAEQSPLFNYQQAARFTGKRRAAYHLRKAAQLKVQVRKAVRQVQAAEKRKNIQAARKAEHQRAQYQRAYSQHLTAYSDHSDQKNARNRAVRALNRL